MKVLVAAEVWPHPEHTQVSANIVIYELIRHLSTAPDFQVVFVCVCFPEARPSEHDEELSRAALGRLGVEIAPPLMVRQCPREQTKWFSRLHADPGRFFPYVKQRETANSIARNVGADVLFIPWSEKATMLFADASVYKFAYYGDPDPVILNIRSKPPFVNKEGVARRFLLWIRRQQFERWHISQMRKYDLLGEVAANDVEYYRSRGVRQAFYLRMTYADELTKDWEEARERLEQQDPVIIVANLGSQRSTGNTLGLMYLTDEVLDSLAEFMNGRQYEVHLLGGGEPISEVARKLQRPEVRNRGYVEDINLALLEAPVFVCCNNATEYKRNQSRYLHVWSLGGCIVAHQDAALSMPELVHGETALLGRDGRDIARLVRAAIDNKSLRRRIGRNGYRCFSTLFEPSIIADQVGQKMRAICH